MLLAAVRNNAEWCDSVAPGIFGATAWYSARRTPVYTLDLARYGFVELFRAQWIHRCAGSPGQLDVDAVLTHAAGVVGVSNVAGNVWPSVIASAAARFPGLPLAGYEHGAGFTAIGPLVVWQRPVS